MKTGPSLKKVKKKHLNFYKSVRLPVRSHVRVYIGAEGRALHKGEKREFHGACAGCFSCCRNCE